MKVLLYSRYGEYPKDIEPLVKSFGLEVVDGNPDVVVTYGGDGTLIGSERDYPGVPKLPLRDSGLCHLCSNLPNEEILQMLVNNQLKTKELLKLEACVGGKILTALNDVVIAHKVPNTALRFRYDNKEFIGDGLVVSTPFGSTGYYYSITKKPFATGIGIAFNNIHNAEAGEIVTNENSEIKVVISRGPGVLAVDNNPDLLNLSESAEILVRKAPESARVLVPAGPPDVNPSSS